MEYKEIALLLTLKAIETGLITKQDYKSIDSSMPIETANQLVAKQVSDFYENILKRLNNR